MEWKLGQLSINGKGTYGIGAPAVPLNSSLFTYLRITDIADDGTLQREGRASIDDPDAINYLLKENDIVFARTGNSTGRTYFYEPSEGDLVYAGFLIKFSLDPNKVNPRILKYYTHSKPYYDWIHSFDTGATRGNINAKTLAEMPVYLPERKIQDKIVDILSSLDAQIENNNRINRNLEAQAQALFKSWFVDFEPWGGKMPEGWKEGKLGEIISQETKKVGTRTDVTVLSPITTGRLVLSEEFFTKQVYSASLAKYKVVEIGSFAYNPARVNIGSMGRNEFDFIGCVSPVYVVFRCLIGYENYFDLLRKTDDFKTEINLRAIGGVRQSLNYEDLARIEIIIPSQSAVERFNTTYDQLKLLIRNNTEANARLASLRDTLLPKLMKGEIDV